MNLYIMMRKMLRRDSTSRRCCSSSSQSRRDAVAYSTMMAVVLLFLLPLPSNSFQSPKIAARNLLRDVKGQDTIIKTVPNVEVTVANPFVMANNNEKSEQKSEEMRLELTDGTDEGRNADEDQLELIAPDGGDDNDGDNKEAIVRRNKAMASLLLLSAGSRRSTARDTNSMGARRRVGSSASKGRGGIPNKTSHLFTAVRRAANAAAKSIIDDSANNATKISQIAIDIDTTSIESSFLERNAGMDYTKQMVSPTTQMGVLGAAAAADEATMATSHPLLRKPQPGTLLIQPKKVERSNSIMSKESLIVRVATHFYDMDIASLRLSVFSDFSPAMRQQFSSRARQVLSNRRRRGAMCLVATIPAKSRRKDGRTDIVLGRIECSVHEFYGTLLGRRRKENSVLYITEVAVNPLYRRCGIGTKLLEGVDELATKYRNNVESLYLHVDVMNEAALHLYHKCGYSLVVDQQATDDQKVMYREFTTVLNLHDGATRGRNHYLLVKHLRTVTWLFDEAPSIERSTPCSVEANNRVEGPPQNNHWQRVAPLLASTFYFDFTS